MKLPVFNFSCYAIFVMATCFLICSCSVYKTSKYFQVHENQIERYDGIFIKYQNGDTNYRKIENLFGNVSGNDTILEVTEITYKSYNIDGHKALYAIETKDTSKLNSTIGPLRFLMCAIIFYHDTVYFAPAYKKGDLKNLQFTDFKYKIPPTIRKKDTITVIDGKKTMLLCNFRKASLIIKNKRIRNCLVFDILNIWPEATFKEKVWLNKKLGLLKWIRTTGRTETRIF